MDWYIIADLLNSNLEAIKKFSVLPFMTEIQLTYHKLLSQADVVIKTSRTNYYVMILQVFVGIKNLRLIIYKLYFFNYCSVRIKNVSNFHYFGCK